jgi:hypothetical protein
LVSGVTSIARLTAGEVVAIDGKAMRGTRKAGNQGIVHLVSAWANTNNLVLAQRKVDDKSNEITAIPKLLAALELSGTVVTIDAMGWQTAIAEKIVDKKADYILAVKRISRCCWMTSRILSACLPPTLSPRKSTAAMGAWNAAPVRCSGT